MTLTPTPPPSPELPIPARPLKVLVWATTFGADLWSFTRFLAARPEIDVRIVLADPDGFRKEGVHALFPIERPMRRRRAWSQLWAWPGFTPDVTVMDNRVPLRAPSRKGFMLWHGFGWKGPNDREEFKVLHAQLRHAFGDPLTPNANFRWQCFGPWDFEHRTQTSGFHPDNCRILGAASHDDLRTPVARERLAPYYPFDVTAKKTVLIAPTWHYGEVFAHWGKDLELFDQLLSHLRIAGANVILRFHDSYRFEPTYRAALEGLVARHPHALLKFKDHHPDNYLDLQVADVLVTNYSSIANLFYATLRPTIHVYPVRSADEAFAWRTLGLTGVRTRTVSSARFVWKLPPEDHGGLVAQDFGALLGALDQALADPACCRAKAQAFLDRHMLGADGHACERTLRALYELVDAR